MKKSIQLSIPIEEVEESVDESSDWRHIIFLPFHHVWETLLSISVLVNAMCSTFDIFYKPPERKYLIVAYYFGEIMYFADFFLAIMHRKMLKVRRKRHHRRRQMGYILIDAVTLLPLFEVKSFLSMSTWKHRVVETTDYLKLKCLIRLYRIVFQISRKTVQVGLNQLVNHTIAHAITIFVLGHIMGAALYSFISLNNENWTLNLSYHKFDRDDVYNWLTICFYTMTSIVMHNLSGIIIPIAMIEKILFGFAMLLGFYLHMMLFFGALILTFKKNFRGYFEYETLVAKIMNLLHQWDVEDDLKAKTLDFLTVFWQKRSGIRSMPKMFHLLPMSLRKEVTLDIFWEALRHSHIFIGTDLSFKRSISLVMKSEFLVQGDFLIRTGESKNKMVYIVSGIIQVLSVEDDDSPIMSFSSGTLLSETACLMSSVSGTNLRSATYCEIQTLALTDLATVLQNFPRVARYIRQQLSNRLSTAQYHVKKRKYCETASDSDTIIKTLKRRWYEIWHLSNKGISPSVANVRRDEQQFHVDNLNLLVLSDSVELRVKSICLSGECPYVMDPDSSFRKFCDFTILGAVLLQCIIIPQATFFQRKLTKGEESLCFLLDVIYYLDIYIQLSTAVKKKDRLITVPKEIIVIRLKQFTFLLDFFASFPFDLFALVTSCAPEMITFYKLLKLLKIYKIFNTITELEMNIIINTFAMRIIKYFILFAVSIYWTTCALYGLSCHSESCDPTSWYIYNNQIYNMSKSAFYKYRLPESLFLTMSLFTNYGGSSFDQYNILDIVLSLIAKIIGYLLFSYGFCELAATTILKHQAERTNRMYLWTLKREATQFKIETSVHNSVLSFLNFHLSVREGCQIFGEDNIFTDTPIELKDEIVRHRIINCLKKVHLFSHSNDDLLRYICAHSELKLVPPNSKLIKVQNKSDLLYVVMRGYCKMVSYLPGDYERKSTAVLKSGNTFPFLETFHGAFSFITVTSITVVELLLIQTKTIINALQTYEGDFACFRNALAEHREVYGSILFRKDAKLSMIRTVDKATDHGDIFIYNVYDVDNIKFDEEAYLQPFLRIGPLSFLRFFLLRKTINPKGWFFTVWETFRCTIAIVQMMVAIATPNIMSYYEKRAEIILVHYGFGIVWLIDLYIRMHCQYYNEIGILVTHPYSTAKHYISTSFIVDVTSNVPINIFKLDMLLGTRYQIWCNTLMLMLTRFLQLHRPFSGLSYLEEKYKGRTALLINRIKFFTVTVIVIGMMQVIVQLCSCDDVRLKYHCQPNRGYSQLNRTSFQYFVNTYYKVSTFFTLATNGSFKLDSYSVVVSLFVMFPLLILRWTFLIKIISRGIGGNVELATYRHRMATYRRFVKGAYVSDKIIQDIADHHEYVWRKSQGMNMFHVMKYFHPQLEQDMAYSLYSTCLEKAVLFRDEHASLFQAISPLFHREYYTKEAKIIQCNDIQSKIYFVLEGIVSISIANTKMCSMGKGGMFGCLSKAGVTRQTMTATTTVLSTVLSVDSKLFHKTVASFPNVVKRMRRINSLNYEYLEAYSNTLVEIQTDTVVYSGIYEQNRSFYDKILINGDSRWCRALDYIINVHIAPMSAIFVLAVSFTHLHAGHNDFVKTLIYTLDTICLVKLYLKFHMIYVDAESGHMVKDPYAIRMRYARTTFWFDLLAIIPLEVIVSCFTNNTTIQNLCVLNRVFRFTWLVLYYKHASVKVSISKHLNWTYQIYLNLFQIQIMVCVWLLAACHNSEGARCWYDSSHTLVETSMVQTNSSFDSSVLSYIFIMNVISATGLRIVRPLNLFQYVVTVIISLIAQYLVLDLFSGAASLYMVENHVFELYEMKFKRLWTYLQGRDLSAFLSTKVWNYCAHLWEWQRGNWMPKLIQDAPNYLKEDMLQALYGRYLANHFLFANTHIDFLRQLVVCFERCVFLPEDSIVEKGDSDCCMYFVNKGDVDVFDVQGKSETKVDCLTVGRSFGEAQGLLCIPHKFTYRANTITELLILDRNKWSYLLKWFPASNQEIIAKATEYSLFREERNDVDL